MKEKREERGEEREKRERRGDRGEERREKREDKTRGEIKRADKRQDEKEERRNYDFFWKSVSRPSNPPDELAQHVSNKNLFRTNYSSIFLRTFRISPCFQLFT